MKKILHIVDDSLFTDVAYQIFESVSPGLSEYVLFSKEKKLKQIKNAPVKVYPPWFLVFYCFLQFLTPKYDGLILHGLDIKKALFLKCTRRSTRVCWLGHGVDYYFLTKINLLKSKTRELKNIEKLEAESSQTRLKNVIKRYLFFENDYYGFLFKNIDYFSPVIRDDYLLVSSAVTNFNPEYVSWNYGTLEDHLIRNFEGLRATGPNILLGNSSTYENNHLDAFDFLETVDFGERKIITPLSYGDEKYREIIVHHGKKCFGDKFVPILDFLPIEDYVKQISSCSIVIMNHLRQQALGNIIIMLYLGAKVFLDSDNPLFNFLKKQGITIYSIESLFEEVNSPLPETITYKNREVIKSNWSRDVIFKKTNVLISKLIN